MSLHVYAGTGIQLKTLLTLLQVSYTDLTSTQSINTTDTNIVLNNLLAGVQYSIVVTAITNTGRRIDSNRITGLTCRLNYFNVLMPAL